MRRDEVSETQRKWRKWYQEHPTVDLEPNYIPPEYQSYLKNDKLNELQKKQKEISSSSNNKKDTVYIKVNNDKEETLLTIIGILLVLIITLISIIICMII